MCSLLHSGMTPPEGSWRNLVCLGCARRVGQAVLQAQQALHRSLRSPPSCSGPTQGTRLPRAGCKGLRAPLECGFSRSFRVCGMKAESPSPTLGYLLPLGLAQQWHVARSCGMGCPVLQGSLPKRASSTAGQNPLRVPAPVALEGGLSCVLAAVCSRS